MLTDLWAAARRRFLVGARERNVLETSFVIELMLSSATVVAGGRCTKRQVDGAVVAEEPANGADTNALLDRVSLPQLQGQIQTGLNIELLVE